MRAFSDYLTIDPAGIGDIASLLFFLLGRLSVSRAGGIAGIRARRRDRADAAADLAAETDAETYQLAGTITRSAAPGRAPTA